MIDDPQEHNLTVRIGRSFRKRFRVVGQDLTGWTIAAQIRESQDSAATEIASFTVEIPNPADGIFYLNLANNDIDGITQASGQYDVVLVDPSGFADTYFYGEVSFVRTATARPVPPP